MKDKTAHHLWFAEKDESGKVMVHRNKQEIDNVEDMEREAFKVIEASAWGLYGAYMEDEFAYNIPKVIVDRFSIVAKSLGLVEEAPYVYSWEKLAAVVGDESINNIKESVSFGRKARALSKELNIPFVVAFDLVEDSELIGKKALKEIVDGVKNGEALDVIEIFGKPAIKVASIYGEALAYDTHKIAVDEAAEDYWISYYGDFGKQLVDEIKKRVKADVAKDWLLKNGVDEAAAEYWKNYYSEVGDYGKKMVEKVKVDREVKKDKEDKEDKKGD
jgi:cell division protein FtsB